MRAGDVQREPPADVAIEEAEAVGHPVAEREAGNVHDHLDNDQLATPTSFGGLALPDRCCCC